MKIGRIAGTVVFIVIAGIGIRHYLVKRDALRQLMREERTLIGSPEVFNRHVEDMQKVLSGLMFYDGPVNGMMGPQTRLAIKKFQEYKQLHPTGWVDVAVYSELTRQQLAASLLASQKRSSSASSRSGRISQEKTKDEVSIKQKLENQDKILSSRLEAKARVRDIQTRLKKAGFYAGAIDGKAGKQTKEAIRSFQKSVNIKADGIVGPKTLDALSRI